jgi:hypothetical protein
MIRPDTKPGTDVVCISAGPGRLGPVFLTEGAVYTVKQIVKGVDDYCVLLADLPPIHSYKPPWGMVQVGFDLSRFRYLDLPRSLTELLEEVELV